MRGAAQGMDKEFWEGLTTGTGPLAAGVLPAMDVQQEQNMALALTGGEAAKAKAKKVKKAEDEKAIPVEPASKRENFVFTLSPVFRILK